MIHSRAYYVTRTIVRVAFWTAIAAAVIALLGVMGHADLQHAQFTDYQLTHLPTTN